MPEVEQDSNTSSTSVYGMTPGQFLQRRRHEWGLTPEELAKRVGVHRTAVYHWEAGRTKPRAAEARKLAEILSTTFLGECILLAAFGYCLPALTENVLHDGKPDSKIAESIEELYRKGHKRDAPGRKRTRPA